MSSSIWKAALGTALLLAAPPVLAVDLNLCASFNTADSGRNVSIYQTNGLCSDFCRADFAYAITQDEACWCSDYTPSEGSQVDLGRCDINCPAFPSENCGGPGLFGYVELNGKLPEGTRGPNDDDDDTASSTTASSEEPTSTTEPEPEPTTSSTSSSTSTSTTSSSEEPMSTSEIQTVTTDGEIRTVTVVPTVVPTNDPDEGNDGGSSSDDGGGGLGTGGIVGIVVGVIGGILAIAGALLFWFFKKRKRNNQSAYQEDPSVRGDSSDRMGSSRPDMAMANNGSGSPTSGVGSNSNRNSALAIDPRMDPFKQGLYMRNASHESINTLRDDHDYSRRIQQPKVLRATNPDPDNTG